MKVVILAGGFGTRLSEKTNVIPKPMVEIGGRPMLWHIMKTYAFYGFDEFVIALGYKGEIIKEYFLHFHALHSDLLVDLSTGTTTITGGSGDYSWKINLVDTGSETMTGGRLGRLKSILGSESFLMTYGDAVTDVNIRNLVDFHQSEGRKLTLTAVHPRAHYGELELDGTRVKRFMEKPQFRQSWINGGFMVIEPDVLNIINSDESVFEREPLESLASIGELGAYKHEGFWQCMDTLRDVRYLEKMWSESRAPWAIWDDNQRPR